MSSFTDHSRRTGPALEAMYQLLLWLIPTVSKFPRDQKFLLGDRKQVNMSSPNESDMRVKLD